MLKNIAKIFSSHVIVKALGLFNIAITLNFLSVQEFGSYSYSLLLLHLISIIVDPFLSAHLTDIKMFNYKKYNFGTLALTLLLLPLFYVFLNLFHTEITPVLFLAFSMTFIFSASLKSYLNVRERYYQYGSVDVLRQLSIFLSTLMFFYVVKKSNIIELLEYNYILSAIVMFLLFIVFIKKKEINFSIKKRTLKKLTTGSRFLILYLAIVPLISFIDSYFVEKYLSDTDLGLYSFSLKIYMLSMMLIVPIFTVLNIRQIEVAKQKNYSSFLEQNIKKVSTYSIVFIFFIMIANWVIVTYVFPAYKASLVNTMILLCAAFVSYITIPFSFLIASRKYKYLFVIALIAITSSLLINYFFIKHYGTLIAALSTLTSQIIINLGAAILSYFLFYKKSNE